MNRAIVGFHCDPESHWVAELACGHDQHTRHAPPFTEPTWVLTRDGRESRLGSPLDCERCDRSELPQGFEPYHRTRNFSEESVPDALLRAHSTKSGVWALIHVSLGRLDYHVHAPFDRTDVLTPATPGVVLPEVEHHVACPGAVEFFVEFWRRHRSVSGGAGMDRAR